MGIFSRKRSNEPVRRGRHALPEPGDPDYVEPELLDVDDDTGAGEWEPRGPYDVEDAPQDDGVPRMDLGSVRVPVPEGAQVQVEMDRQTGNLRAVHVVTPHGQATISAYAAPRTGRLWPEVSTELAEQLRADGGTVRGLTGEWGRELSVRLGDAALYFVGVDGPRWMLRGVMAGPPQVAEGAPDTLRDLVRQTIVVRGSGPMPVRNPLPITLPPAMAEHVAEQRQ